jgi:putative oxidoreductase
MKNVGLLVLRLTLGLLMAGHGSQKLFGWFKGPGIQGTVDFMEMLGMKPGQVWGRTAALGEFFGGVLTALGFLNPVGPLNIIAAMSVATRKVHWKLPVWASQGGAELPLMNAAAALSIALAGPGRFSLDHLFGIRAPRWFNVLAALTTVGVVYVATEQPQLAGSLPGIRSTAETGTSSESTDSSPDLEMETRPRQETPERQTTA